MHRIEADGVTLSVLEEGAGSHWLQLDQPGRVNELLLDFLASA